MREEPCFAKYSQREIGTLMLAVLIGGVIAVAAQWLFKRIARSRMRQTNLKSRYVQVISTLESFSDAIHSATFSNGDYSWDQDQYFDAVKSLKRQHPPQNVLRRLNEANHRRIEVETMWRNLPPANRRNDEALHRSLLSYETTIEAFAVEASILVRLSAP